MNREKDFEFESKALTLRFWNFMAKLLLLPDNFEGTLGEYGVELDVKVTDGFFYQVVLPILIKNGILVKVGKESKRYLGRPGIIYRLNKRKLEEFCVKNSLIFRILYKKWVQEGDVEMDLL